MVRACAMLVGCVFVVGCNEPPEKKCVTLQVKLAKKAENCGIVAAPPREELQKRCDSLNVPQRDEAIKGMQYMLEAETCEALKVRLAEIARRAGAPSEADSQAAAARFQKMANDPEFKKQNEEFNAAFKKALEEAQKKHNQQGGQ